MKLVDYVRNIKNSGNKTAIAVKKADIIFAQKAATVTISDLSVAEDLLDTLNANREICVGIAANIIGVNKRIIVEETLLVVAA